MTCEDSQKKTIVPRLIAAGADLTKVHFIVGHDDITEGISFGRDLAEIEEVSAPR